MFSVMPKLFLSSAFVNANSKLLSPIIYMKVRRVAKQFQGLAVLAVSVFRWPGLIEEKAQSHQELSGSRDNQSVPRSDGFVHECSCEASRDQCRQEKSTSISWAVMTRNELGVHDQVNPCRRRHSSGDLLDFHRTHGRYLSARAKREQCKGYLGWWSSSFAVVYLLKDSCSKCHGSLYRMCEHQPQSASSSNQICDLTGHDRPGDEQSQAYADVVHVKEIATQPGQPNCQHHRVASLVRCETVKIWERDRILNTSAESEDKQLDFDEEIDTDSG